MFLFEEVAPKRTEGKRVPDLKNTLSYKMCFSAHCAQASQLSLDCDRYFKKH